MLSDSFFFRGSLLLRCQESAYVCVPNVVCLLAKLPNSPLPPLLLDTSSHQEVPPLSYPIVGEG